MQAVTNFNEDNANVITHGKQQFLEVFGLCRGMISKYSTAYFCQSVYDLGNLLAKNILNVFDGIIGILYHIV